MVLRGGVVWKGKVRALLNWYKSGIYTGIKTAMSKTPSEAQRRALGEFLKAHRARLSPESAGLAVTGRRRTPGLRREEVAHLAGLSATWYCWMEQGRDISVSPHALTRLAEALQLTPAERAYLFDLTGKRDPALHHDEAGGSQAAPPALQAALTATGCPAYLMDHRWNLMAWNPAAERLFAGWLDRPEDHNLLRFVFLHPVARRLIVDWDERARRVLAEFRADYSRHLEEGPMTALVEELLAASAVFAVGWREQQVYGRDGGERLFRGAGDEVHRYEQVSLLPAARPDLKLVMLTGPAARAL